MDKSTLECLNAFYAGAQGPLDIMLCGTETTLRDVPGSPRTVEETVAAYTGSVPLFRTHDGPTRAILSPLSRASLFPARLGEE